METVPLDSFHLLRPTEPPAGHLAAPASSGDQYSTREIEAATTIQQFWRYYFPKLRPTRAFREKPETRAAQFFIVLGVQTSATVAMRVVLVTQGVHVYLTLRTAQDALQDLRKRAIAYSNDGSVPVASFELLDSVQSEHLPSIDGLLSDASEKLSKGHLMEQIENGSPAELRNVLMDVERVVKKAGDRIMGVKRVFEKVKEGMKSQ